MPSAKPSSTELLAALAESGGRIAAEPDEKAILARTCSEAERIVGARALWSTDGGGGTRVPVSVRDEELGALVLERDEPLEAWELGGVELLAELAARAVENARLVVEAKVRETDSALLSDRIITAEQDERRRLALFLHDGAVQSLSGIGLMLEAVAYSVEAGRLEEATTVLGTALQRHRETIRSLRDLSFNLEPVVLRDQGFGPAVQELAGQIGLSRGIQIVVDVDDAERLPVKAQVALYQIIHETLDLTIRRGPPTRIAISVRAAGDGSVVAVVSDDGAGERRRASFDQIAERARTISGTLHVETGEDGGTEISIVLPPYVARR